MIEQIWGGGLTAFSFWSLIGAYATGVVWGAVTTGIIRASRPRVVRMHPEDREFLESIEYRLRIARVRAALVELYAGGRRA